MGLGHGGTLLAVGCQGGTGTGWDTPGCGEDRVGLRISANHSLQLLSLLSASAHCIQCVISCIVCQS